MTIKLKLLYGDKAMSDMFSNDLGPLTPLLQDDTVGIIMINDLNIYVSRQAFAIDTHPVQFRNRDELMTVLTRLLRETGPTPLDGSVPIIERRLSPDGTRIQIVLPPVAVNGPAVTILRPPTPAQVPGWETLVRYGSITEPIVEFLRACVKARVNIVVSGGTGSGKHTLLNLLANMIRPDARILLVEPEVNLRIDDHANLVKLEAQPSDVENGIESGVSMRRLVEVARKMRPDRLIVSEVSGPEALPIVEAMSSGVEGSMFLLHATSPRDALSRLEIMLTMANPSLPLLSIRQQMATALQIIVQIEILQDGWRRIVKVSEVGKMVGDTLQLDDIFEFVQTSPRTEDRIPGKFTATGYRPGILAQIANAGVTLPNDLFQRS
jgi:pilus assembly protein CpaF